MRDKLDIQIIRAQCLRMAKGDRALANWLHAGLTLQDHRDVITMYRLMPQEKKVDSLAKVYTLEDIQPAIEATRDPANGLHIQHHHAYKCHGYQEVRIIAPSMPEFHAARFALSTFNQE